MASSFLNNPAFTTENLLRMSAEMFAAPSFAQGMGGSLNALSSGMTEAKEKQKADEIINKTATLLDQQSPELAEMVRSGAMTASDGYRTYLQQKRDAAEAAKPKYITEGGKIIRLNESTGATDVVADYSSPKLPAIAEEYNWAKSNGFSGSPQEYQVWKSGLGKQKGMVIESDGNGGFRMVQGDVDTSKMPKLTEAEGKNAGFLKRALSAEKELSALESEGTSLWNRAADAVPVLGNFAKSDDAQKFDQAQRNFINSVLRRESGAVISPEEFDNARKQYFPQPGDGADVIAQKRQNRADAIKGFEIGSGPAASRVQEMDANETSAEKPGVIGYEEYFK